MLTAAAGTRAYMGIFFFFQKKKAKE